MSNIFGTSHTGRFAWKTRQNLHEGWESISMAWLFLVIAIVLEVAATSMLPLTHEFTRFRISAAVLVLYGGAFFLLANAVRQIDIGVVYALWSALGTAAVVALGVLFHGERVSRVKVAGLALTVVGIVAMNFGA